MSTIRDLLHDADRRRLCAVPEADALREKGSLDEAYLLSVEPDAASVGPEDIRPTAHHGDHQGPSAPTLRPTASGSA